MKSNIRDRDVSFEALDGCLVRTVRGKDGRAYAHRCAQEVYRSVAHAVQETPPQGEGITAMQIARVEKLPFTQVNVALEFMKERGVVTVRGRRSYPGSAIAFEDAMIEYHTLAQHMRLSGGEPTP